jgi:asparagine synthase (glutamine-hydrolysing)
MCGIAGYWNLNSFSLPNLCESMKRRGPDSQGTFIDENVSFFHTRLSIIDLSANGSQPMEHKSGIVISFNGEIYNFKELKQNLLIKGYSFESSSDTEVLLNLYRDQGMEFLSSLIGMFAIAIYDYRFGLSNSKLILARDQFGIKPLLYSKVGGGLLFGSELKTLLASGIIKPEIDFTALRDLIAIGSVYQPRTLIKNVFSLSAGTYLELTKSGNVKNILWAKNSSSNENYLKHESILDAADFTISESIKKHLVSDVPVSCLLSGGLDSSLIAAIIKAKYDPNIQTFTLGFKGNSKQSETEFGRTIAQYIGSNHHELTVNIENIESDLIEFISAIDQPSMDGLNSFLVFKEISKFSRVVISGTGGDEMFAGYPWFSQALSKRDNRSRNFFSHKVRKNSEFFSQYKYFFEKFGYAGQLGTFSSGLQAFGYSQADKFINVPANTSFDFINSYLDFQSRNIPKNFGSISRLSHFCLQGYTKNQILRDVDSTSMYFSLEVRVPFISQEVYKFAQQLPDEWKIGPRNLNAVAGSYQSTGEKYILQQLAKKYLPDSLLQRNKQGFELPLDEWLRGPLFNLVKDKFAQNNLNQFGFLNAKAISSLLDDFTRKKAPAIRVWLILVFILWYESLSKLKFQHD